MKILNNKFFLMLLILPFLKPSFLEYIPLLSFIDTLFDGMKIIAFIVIIFLYIKNKKISPIMTCLILYQIALFISTVVNNGNHWKLAVNCGTIISFGMLTELGIKNNCRLFLKTLLDILSVMICANLMTIILFPQGIAQDNYYGNIYYLLGIRNGFPPVLIPVMGLTILYSSFYEKKLILSAKLLITVISISILITWSATGVVGWFILLFFILFIYKNKYSKFLNAPFLYFVYIIMFIAIVLLRLQSYFSYIIENILHKNISFTGRTDIWDIAIALIKRSPMLGYGVYEGHGLIFYRNQFYYAHNAVLEVMLQGGLFALFFFIMMLVFSAIFLNKYKTHPAAQIITFTIFAMMCMMLMEAYLSFIWFYALLTISGCVPDIVKQLEQKDFQCKKPEASLRTKYISYRLKGR